MHIINARMIHSRLLVLELRISQYGAMCVPGSINAISLYVPLYFVALCQVYCNFTSLDFSKVNSMKNVIVVI